ncbi:hypothetical protein LINPERHAP1_LOCUS39866 [Linum perenne]
MGFWSEINKKVKKKRGEGKEEDELVGDAELPRNGGRKEGQEQ